MILVELLFHVVDDQAGLTYSCIPDEYNFKSLWAIGHLSDYL